MARPMTRTPACRVALTSSIALLVGMGAPLEQAFPRSLDWTQWRPDAPAMIDAEDHPSGFQMVPTASAPPAKSPKPSAETPGAGGFELLPPTPADQSAPAAARSAPILRLPAGQAAPVDAPVAEIPAPRELPSGFSATQPAAPAPAPAPTPAAAPTAPEDTHGFVLLPATAVEQGADASARAPAAGVDQPAEAETEQINGFTLVAKSAPETAGQADKNSLELRSLVRTPAAPRAPAPARMKVVAAPAAPVAPAAAPVVRPKTPGAAAVAAAPTPHAPLVAVQRPHPEPAKLAQPPRAAAAPVAASTPPVIPAAAPIRQVVERASAPAEIRRMLPVLPADGGFELIAATAGADAVEADALAPEPAGAPRGAADPGIVLVALADPADRPTDRAPSDQSGGFDLQPSASAPAQTSQGGGFELTNAPSAPAQAPAQDFQLTSTPTPAPAAASSDGFQSTTVASAPPPTQAEFLPSSPPASQPRALAVQAPPEPAPAPELAQADTAPAAAAPAPPPPTEPEPAPVPAPANEPPPPASAPAPASSSSSSSTYSEAPPPPVAAPTPEAAPPTGQGRPAAQSGGAGPGVLGTPQLGATPSEPAPTLPAAAPPASESPTAPANPGPSVPTPAPAPPATAPAASATPAPAAPPALPPITRPLGVVGRIVVQGNERIEPSTITSYLPIQVGDAVDAARLDLAVKTLFRTDLFADVSVELQGTDLVVKVSENPIINQVVFEGNHALKEDKLRDEVTIRPRGIFTRSRVDQDVQRIIELYRRSGRISASVTPKIVQLPQKRVDLIFEIDEGPKSGILSINFIGNKSYGDNALRDVIVTRESHWYKLFQSNDNYDPDRVEYDAEQLRKFYRNHGFYDFRIISNVAELASDKNGFVVTFTIEEGPKYHFGKLRVETQLKRLNADLLQALLPIREGQLYEDERIEKATEGLTYAAGANGFAFVDIRPRNVAHPENKTVDVTFDIREGPRVYIERIDVVGNTQTLDRVIRREMRVAEGDAYNRVLVDRSKNQIRALGFFKDVDIEQLPGSAPDKTVLRVKVTEQPTGQLTFSLGYSSVEKLVGDVGISQANFRGRGQNVNLEVSLGYLRKQIQLSFTEPRFMGRNLSAGFDLYTYRYNFSDQASFETASTGLNLRLGFPINPSASLGLRYSIHGDNVTIPDYVVDPNTGLCIAGYSQSLCDEIGTTLTSLVGYSVRWDRRNDPIIPTRGFYIDFSQDFAGLGGSVHFIRTQASGAWYYGITPKWIFSVLGSAGYITGWGGDVVRINDRFFEGGTTFRGFEIAGIGPRDVSVVTSSGSPIGDALGGKLFAIGSVELTVPTPLPQQYGIKTALFTDFGTVGLLDPSVKRNPDGTIDTNIRDDLAFRASAGVSVFWKSPMGPLRFDFSKVLKKAPYDRTETFQFTTTTNF